jgi:hypothetical protein
MNKIFLKIIKELVEKLSLNLYKNVLKKYKNIIFEKIK